ncbi:MAG: hypothetical protein ACW981_13460 [Candidatus Hodarchaeales archaeon]|jgi:hypothetical protein
MHISRKGFTIVSLLILGVLFLGVVISSPNLAAQEPIDDLAAQEPVNGPAAQEPVNGPAAQEPVNGPAAQEPVGGPW